MSAYNSNFITPLNVTTGLAQLTGATVSANITEITEKELLVAGGEVIFAGDPPDIVEQITSTTPLLISISLQSVNSEGATVPYVPGTVVDAPITDPLPDTSQLIADVTTQEDTRFLELHLDAFAGSYVLAHKKSRAWRNPMDPAPKFILYESSDSGVSFTQRAMYASPIGDTPPTTVLRASDKVYLSMYMIPMLRELSPTIYLTKGTIGGTNKATAYKWERPYLPIALGCDGTKFVMLTEGHRIYHSLDGISWDYKGLLPAAPFPYVAISTGVNRGWPVGDVRLLWLPTAAKWVIQGMWGYRLYITSDVNAREGWVKCTGFDAVITEAGTNVVSYHLASTSVVELAGNLYMVGHKTIEITGSPTVQRSVVYKSTDLGLNWTVSKEWQNQSLYGTNGEDAVFDNIGTFGAYLVMYTRGPQPKRYKSNDGVTWIPEQTNLPFSSNAALLLLPTGALAGVSLVPGDSIIRYAANGLLFDDAALSVEQVDGSIVAPVAASDPYWASVRAMSNMGYPLGALPDPIPTRDAYNSQLSWSGYTAEPQSTLELPFAGTAAVKAAMYYPPFVTTWKEAKPHTIAFNPVNYILGGDYTYEQFLATNSLYDAIRFSCANARFTLGRNLGSVMIGGMSTPLLPEILIQTGEGYTLADFTSVPVFEIPAALTYFHICVERYGNVISIYLNGVLMASAIQPLVYPCLANFSVGARYCGPYRVTAGVARYNGPFTPPTGLFPTSS